MTEQKERGGELPMEKEKMTPEKIIQKISEITGLSNLEIDPEQPVLYNEKGELRYFVTKIIWENTPRDDGKYHGVSFWYDSAAGKQTRLDFKDFNNIIVKFEWNGNKVGDTIEVDEEEGLEVIAYW